MPPISDDAEKPNHDRIRGQIAAKQAAITRLEKKLNQAAAIAMGELTPEQANKKERIDELERSLPHTEAQSRAFCAKIDFSSEENKKALRDLVKNRITEGLRHLDDYFGNHLEQINVKGTLAEKREAYNAAQSACIEEAVHYITNEIATQFQPADLIINSRKALIETDLSNGENFWDIDHYVSRLSESDFNDDWVHIYHINYKSITIPTEIWKNYDKICSSIQSEEAIIKWERADTEAILQSFFEQQKLPIHIERYNFIIAHSPTSTTEETAYSQDEFLAASQYPKDLATLIFLKKQYEATQAQQRSNLNNLRQTTPDEIAKLEGEIAELNKLLPPNQRISPDRERDGTVVEVDGITPTQ